MNTLKKMVMIFTTLFAINVASAQDVQITFNQLPASAQTFVKTYFKQNQVASVWKDMEYLMVEDYTVFLNDGTEIEFYPKGDWKSIKSRGTAIPVKVIPAGIVQYVNQNYPNIFIKEVKKKRYGYEVELINDLDLKFSTNGNFLRIDD